MERRGFLGAIAAVACWPFATWRNRPVPIDWKRAAKEQRTIWLRARNCEVATGKHIVFGPDDVVNGCAYQDCTIEGHPKHYSNTTFYGCRRLDGTAMLEAKKSTAYSVVVSNCPHNAGIQL